MADLFVTSPGQVVQLIGSGGNVGLPLAIDGLSGSWYSSHVSLLTEVSLRLTGNYQFTHTLDNLVYLYVFGDRISSLRLGGVTLSSDCPGGGPGGVESLLELYEANRVAARATPLQIQIGSSSAGRFRAALTSFSVGILQPELGLGQFAMDLHVLPKATSSSAAGSLLG